MKNNLRKHVITTFAMVLCLFAIPMTVFAASGSYSSTYNMTGGLYVKKTWDAASAPTFTVSNSNCYSVVNDDIFVLLKKKSLLGYSTDAESTLSSRYSSTCTLKGSGSGTYKIYLRQITGYQMTGNIDVSWRW